MKYKMVNETRMNRVSGRLASNGELGERIGFGMAVSASYELPPRLLVQPTIKQQFNVWFDCSDS
jgi:hypothetical protein